MSVSSATKPVATGRFTSRPGKHIEDEFRRWVEQTGQPDTWRYHDLLPRISHLREEVAALEPIAAEVDRVRQLIWQRSSKTACTKLFRIGGKGVACPYEVVQFQS